MRDLHTHTARSDGANTPEEMIQAAIALGLEEIGISDHSFVACDLTCGLPEDGLKAYMAEINALKEKYADAIRVRLGIEQDIQSGFRPEGLDYAIGSVHYVGNPPFAVDDTPEKLAAGVAAQFCGDWYAMCEAYFAEVSRVIEVTGADIVGHFDLVCKFNEQYRFFDESHPRYIAAWQAAADALLQQNVPFEINTGAISRGWKTGAYPAAPIRAYLAARGARFLLSGDSHKAENLCFAFADYEENT